MASNNTPPTSITPASLYSLAIYNPSLGPTDETLPDQIVFWTSRTPTAQNDSLRQIGLAQGIVEFARSGFSKCQDLSCVETQKSRIVITELEPGWWILAYIDFTRIHYDATEPYTVDYSPREVAPPGVLLAQLRTSYNQFVFSNGTFEHILTEYGRLSLTARLNKFYNKWAWQWDVMLSGNPSVDIWSGIRIGRGVGEEEKEVLSGFVERNQKKSQEQGVLIDMMVSRFNSDNKKGDFTSKGSGKAPGDGDGCIYRGVGSLTAESIRDVTEWMARWSQYGDGSYRFSTRTRKRKRPVPNSINSGIQPAVSEGQIDGTPELSTVEVVVEDTAGELQPISPETESVTNVEPDKQMSGKLHTPTAAVAALTRNLSEDAIAPPLPPRPSLDGTRNVSSSSISKQLSQKLSTKNEETQSSGYGKSQLMYDVLTLGTYSAYSAWGRYHQGNTPSKPSTPEPPVDDDADYEPVPKGKFVIGYNGDLEDEEDEELNETVEEAGINKISKKTVWIQRTFQSWLQSPEEDTENNATEETYLEECRLVIYINYPFTFALLFSPSHPLLSKPSFYRALHYQLGPLQEPLIASSLVQPTLSASKRTYDLIFDPDTLTVHTSLPNIPDPHPMSKPASGSVTGLARIEALHIHTQLVKLVEDTRWKGNIDIVASGERERTNRTTRGWWIGWMKLEGVTPHPPPIPSASSTTGVSLSSPGAQTTLRSKAPATDDNDNNNNNERRATSAHSNLSFPQISSQPILLKGRREAFIVRKESDSGSGSGSRGHKRGGSKAEERMGTVSGSSSDKGGKITEGLGVDPRRYFEQLLDFSART